ncbi:MAG: chromosome segregation protein SMC, partial [Planctomycetes bacterium]|nr:chromosome segregation protein SMC [Planctomycetota bacterium]
MYLKKLELLGFKSFADRTEFQFRPGITAVVGPNGCGKSNVVDAFKWIFGEQSAKGLRGSEMKDVIFNGTQTRKPSGFAEVTVVFDNEDRYLDIDYAEVSVTRRLFRSGESEYLINRQKCRLKDIKDLFLDTGIGQSSYSILEQGKVDVLLQSSAFDRRVIFEEAAGISKYRVKRAEALRALLRVEENLNRLQDVIDEVEKRIRRVKAQASKARRYKEYSDRLKDLRVRIALEEYHESVKARAGLSFRLYWAGHRIGRQEDLERRLHEGLERHVSARQELAEQIRSLQERIADEQSARERVQERGENARVRRLELAEQDVRKHQEMEETLAALEETRRRLEEDGRRRDDVVRRIAELRHRAEEAASSLQARQEAHRQGQERLQAGKETEIALIQKKSKINNSIVQVESEIGNLEARKSRLENAIAGFDHELEECRRRGETIASRVRDIAEKRQGVEAEAACLNEEVDALERQVASLDEDLNRHREDLHRKSSRYDVLRSFEETFDGVSSGVAGLIQRMEELPPTVLAHGMIGSLVRVERKYARAVESALGECAEAIVVETQEGTLDLLQFARDENLGAVRAISLDRVDAIPPEFFPRQGGVCGALRDFVATQPRFDDLLDRLLVNVVLVEDLSTAVALSRNGLRPFRLVTLAGELVEPWGGISVAGESEAGIISRRSEMDELLEQVTELEQVCASGREQLAATRGQVNERTETLKQLRADVESLERQSLGLAGELIQVQRDGGRLEREIAVCGSELAESREGIEERVAVRAARAEEARAVDREREEVQEEIRRLEAGLDVSGRDLESASEALSQRRLELAQAEKQEEGLGALIQQQSLNLADRERHVGDLQEELATIARRSAETEATIRACADESIEIATREEQTAAALRERQARDSELLDLEKAFRKEIDKVRKEADRLRREREDLQLKDQEERHRRNTVLERIDEQYGLDLRALLERAEGEGGPAASAGACEGVEGLQEAAAEPGPERQDADGFLSPVPGWDREDARRECKELQGKIQNLGNVNLEALEELEELEERYEFQMAQKRDLNESEKSLRGIIAEINRKSREMFLETFEKVQGHFGELFRKCFGGGRAELVLEEGADILEAGIEIVARPPGKKLTSLTLMSGGEKTMTTIALLLAIFRSRPSPFC